MAAPNATIDAMAIAYGLESIATRSLATAFDTRPVAVASLILAAISRFDIAMETALALVSDISADTILGNQTVLFLSKAASVAWVTVKAVVATVAALVATT